jgi:hypothetical protein
VKTLPEARVTAHDTQGRTKAQAVAFVRKGAPAFNTCDYLVVFQEDGNGFIYDMSEAEHPGELVLRGMFHDEEYCGSGAVARMVVAVQGDMHKELLSVVLSNGVDAALHRQVDFYNYVSKKPFQMKHVCDLRAVHDGDELGHLTFLQYGEGLATSAEADGHGVRLWTLPE